MDPINQFLVDHVITPLQQARYHLPAMDATHHACVQQFSQHVGQLFGPGGPFTGAAAWTLSQAVNNYLDVETRLTSGGLSQRLSDVMGACDTTAAFIQQQMDWYYSLPWPDSSSSGGISLGTLLGGVGGISLDDGISGLLTALIAALADGSALAAVGIPLAIVAVGTAEYYAQNKLQEANMVLDALLAFSNTMDQEETVQEQPLPYNVGGGGNGGNSGNGNTGRFIAILVLSLLGAAGIVVLSDVLTTTPVNLTPEQEDLAQRLYADYRSSGLSLDDIRKIITDNPNLTEAQLRELLDQYSKVVKNHPKLVGLAGGSLELFSLFIQLAYDPAKTSPGTVLSKGIHEAEIVLDLAEQKKLRWPIKRDPSGDAEVIDGNNQAWDIKGYVSGLKPPFDLAKALRSIKQEFDIAKENVILDVSRLSPKDARALYQAVQKAGWGSKIRWWPAPPTT